MLISQACFSSMNLQTENANSCWNMHKTRDRAFERKTLTEISSKTRGCIFESKADYKTCSRVFFEVKQVATVFM